MVLPLALIPGGINGMDILCQFGKYVTDGFKVFFYLKTGCFGGRSVFFLQVVGKKYTLKGCIFHILGNAALPLCGRRMPVKYWPNEKEGVNNA